MGVRRQCNLIEYKTSTPVTARLAGDAHGKVGGVRGALSISGGEDCEDKGHRQDGLQTPAGCCAEAFAQCIRAAAGRAPTIVVNLRRIHHSPGLVD